MNTATRNENIITGEMLGVIERWYFDGDCVHVLLLEPVTHCVCREPHTWFVNFEGRTRCVGCHHQLLESRARSTQLMSAREAFRIFRGQP